MPLQENIPWYEKWFDSRYYDLLYNDRDENEVANFISNILDHIKPPPNSRILDAGCGKGRHSIILGELGFNVTGIDLSEKNISKAKRNNQQNVKFKVHDIREPLQIDQGFDYIFNLFTTFAYFKNKEDDAKTIQAFYKNLKPNGLLVIDFMNAYQVIEQLITEETKIIDGVIFNIRRSLENGFVVKKIKVSDPLASEDAEFTEQIFEEKIRPLKLTDFKKLLSDNKFMINEVFGDYSLMPYDEYKASRLIIFAQKI